MPQKRRPTNADSRAARAAAALLAAVDAQEASAAGKRPQQSGPGREAPDESRPPSGAGKQAKAERRGRGAKAGGSHQQERGVLPQSTDHTPHTTFSEGSRPDGDTPPDSDTGSQQLIPFPSPMVNLSAMRGLSLKNVGKDKEGKTIPHVRTEKIAALISHMVACGASENDISLYLNIRPGQLRQHYEYELNNGAFAHNMEVAGAILQNAKEGNLNAGIFWTKARMGWDDKSQEKITASPLQINIHT